jgi:thioredoxin 1
MPPDKALKIRLRIPQVRIGLSLFLLLAATAICQAAPELVQGRYPGLSTGLLRLAFLEPMDEETLFAADGGIIIRTSDMEQIINGEEPQIKVNADKNRFYILEQAASDRLLLSQAIKSGIPFEDRDADKAIQTFLDGKLAAPYVSEEEILAYYHEAKDIIGKTPIEDVRNELEAYLLQEKKQAEIRDYIAGLGYTIRLRVNEKWLDKNARIALENPVDRARGSGKPILAEFSAENCTACDMMELVLSEIQREYGGAMTIVPINVVEDYFLASRFGVRSIPVQIFFDINGKEVFRHVGYFPKTEVVRQLETLGVEKN